MKYLIVAFKNRNSLYPFVNMLKRYNIFASIVNTPKSISSSCSLSAKIDYRYYSNLMQFLSSINRSSLIGVFVVANSGNYNQIERVL